MPKPLVAIVGRPNVGKSMLFNKLTGQRAAIVEDTPGVTRDRIYGSCEWRGRTFDLMDTGGIEPGTDSEILQFMRRQAEIGIELARRHYHGHRRQSGPDGCGCRCGDDFAAVPEAGDSGGQQMRRRGWRQPGCL